MHVSIHNVTCSLKVLLFTLEIQVSRFENLIKSYYVQDFKNIKCNVGTELMLLILKQKRIARAGALKALDFATTKSPGNCERFVDQLGLKTIFAMFMGKVKV